MAQHAGRFDECEEEGSRRKRGQRVHEGRRKRKKGEDGRLMGTRWRKRGRGERRK